MRCTRHIWGCALGALLLLGLFETARAADDDPPRAEPAAATTEPMPGPGGFILAPDFVRPPDEPRPAPETVETTPRPPLSPDLATPFGFGASPFGNGPLGHAPLLRLDFRETWVPSEGVSGQPTSLGTFRQDLSVHCPIYQDSANEWSTSLSARWEAFTTHAVLPETGRAFPEDLWNLRAGTTYRHQFDNDWIGGGTISVGSASDLLFHSIDEMTVGLNAFVRIPSGEHNAWLVSLSYSPTGEIAFPIPGVSYYWQPSDRFHANLGLPFQLWYRPIDPVTLDLSYMLLRTVHARATYRPLRRLAFYTAFDWSNESWFLADRTDVNDRFFYYEQRLSGGVQLTLCKYASLDFSTGYVFDRFYFEGQHYSDRNTDRIDVGSGPFASMQFLVRW